MFVKWKRKNRRFFLFHFTNIGCQEFYPKSGMIHIPHKSCRKKFIDVGATEMLCFLTCDVHQPCHAKLVSEHAKRITPGRFL